MSAIHQKLAWARRAIVEMRKAEATASREDFQYNFGAFLGLIGAMRHFISVDPHKQWIQSLDQQDICYCSCIDLRNVDIQVDTASPVGASFFVNANALPATFTEHAYTHKPRPTKSEEEYILRTTPAVEIAERALDFYASTVLPGARSRGIEIT